MKHSRTCNYNMDGICVNSDCPYRADACPVGEFDDVCKYKNNFIDHKTAEIEHLTAECQRLRNRINDLMKDEV